MDESKKHEKTEKIKGKAEMKLEYGGTKKPSADACSKMDMKMCKQMPFGK